MKKRRLPRHRARPKWITGPKIWAFDKGHEYGDASVHASKAQDGPGKYEYGFQPVLRKLFPRVRCADGVLRQKTKGHYFAYEGGKNSAAHGGGGMTPTHALMQAIICDARFVYCLIDRTRFASALENPQPERTRLANVEAAQGIRRPDISATAGNCSIAKLKGRPLDLEIAVTNPVDAYDRYSDLLKAERACIELVVPRDPELEKRRDDLEDNLRSLLYNGTLQARWIVDMDLSAASSCSIDEAKQEMQRRLLSAQEEVARLEHSIDVCARKLSTLVATSSLEAAKQRSLLAAMNKEEAAVLRFAEQRDDDESGGESLLQVLVEWVLPVLRNIRLKTRADRVAAMRQEIMARYSSGRTGILKRLELLERADRQAQRQIDRGRLSLEQEHAELQAGIRAQRNRIVDTQSLLDDLRDLIQRGVRRLLAPDGYELPWVIRFERARWCG